MVILRIFWLNLSNSGFYSRLVKRWSIKSVTFVLCFIDLNGKPVKRFIKLIPVACRSLSEVILEKLSKFDIDFSYTRGQIKLTICPANMKEFKIYWRILTDSLNSFLVLRSCFTPLLHEIHSRRWKYRKYRIYDIRRPCAIISKLLFSEDVIWEDLLFQVRLQLKYNISTL